MKLSVCIPTYNRSRSLANCLHSIIANGKVVGTDVEVCVSDNCSTDSTEAVVAEASRRAPLRYSRNSENIGMARNILRSVEMARGDFVWVLGDDDLLMPGALQAAIDLVDTHRSVDYFYLNSNHLESGYLEAFPHPFDVSCLPKEMRPFSPRRETGPIRFLDLIDPAISFDFLGGIYLSLFRRARWAAHAHTIDGQALTDPRPFSHLENTFPHVIILSRAFSKSPAFFSAAPLSVNLSGIREWSRLYPLVRSVRLVEALGEYRRVGLPLTKYLRCRNSALGYFVPDLVRMMMDRKNSGYAYIHPIRLIASNILFPGFYSSILRGLARAASHLLGALRRKE